MTESVAGPLAGIRVLDLSRLLPGGYLTMLLADLGADVVKVEQPGSGDGLRTSPPLTASGDGGVHVALNRGKRSVMLDLTDDEDRESLLTLAAHADVMVETFRPAVLERLGLGWDRLHVAAPSLVLVSITAYGPQGIDGSGAAAARRPGHDLNVQAEAGAMLLPRSGPDGPPSPATPMADLGAGLHAAVGVLAALRHCDATGQGQRVEVSMIDAVLAMLPLATSTWAVTGESPPSGGDPLTGALACYDTYRCADGHWVALAALEPKFFVRLVELLGQPGLALLQYDPVRQGELRGRLAQAFVEHDRDHWLDLLAGDDTCVNAVRDVGEALAAAVRRGSAVDRSLPDGTTFRQVAPVPRLSATPARVGDAPSALGADTGSVLSGWLADRGR